MKNKAIFCLKSFILLIFITSISPGCLSTSTQAIKKTPTTASVTYGGSSWLGHSPVWVGIEKGLFREKELEVDFRHFDTSDSRMKALVAGQLDFAAVGAITAIDFMASGSNSFYIVANPNSYVTIEGIIAKEDIQSVKALKGKKLGVTFASSAYVLVLDVLEQNGLNPQKDVQLINLKVSEMADAFKKGEVDACAAWTPTFNRLLSLKGAHLLLNDTEFSLYKEYQLGPGPDLLIVRRSFAEQSPHVTRAFLEGYFASIEMLKNHPEESADVLLDLTHLSKDEQIKVLKDVYWYDLARQKKFMTTDQFVWPLQKLADFLAKHKQINQAPQVENWVRTDLLP